MNPITGLLPMAPVVLLLAAAALAHAGQHRLVLFANAGALFAALSGLVALLAFGDQWSLHELLSAAPASHLIAVLTTLLGLIIVRYSYNYLAGEPRLRQ